MQSYHMVGAIGVRAKTALCVVQTEVNKTERTGRTAPCVPTSHRQCLAARRASPCLPKYDGVYGSVPMHYLSSGCDSCYIMSLCLASTCLADASAAATTTATTTTDINHTATNLLQPPTCYSAKLVTNQPTHLRICPPESLLLAHAYHLFFSLAGSGSIL